jgi:hypothetical protein
MKLSVIELSLCTAWAKEHCGEDNPADVLAWKILDVVKEKTRRYAAYIDREVNDIDVDLAAISATFYEEEEPGPDGDPDVAF